MSPVIFLLGAAAAIGLLLSSDDDKAKPGERKVGPEKLPERQFKMGAGMPFHFATVSYVDRARQKTRYPVTWGDRVETWRARDKSANGESEFQIRPMLESNVSLFDPVREGRYPVPSADELRELELEVSQGQKPADRVLILDQFGALIGEATRSPSGVWSISIPLSDSTTFTGKAQ